MSLYDDIDPQRDNAGNSDVSGWSSGFKLLQSQLQAKKASLVQAKRQRERHTAPAPVVDLGKSGSTSESLNNDSGLRFNPQTGRLERPGHSGSSAVTPFISDISPSFLGVSDEYDPLHPNEYESVVKRLRKEREAQRREKQERSATASRHLEKSPLRESQYSDEEEEKRIETNIKPRETSQRGGAAIAPPQALLEEPPIDLYGQDFSSTTSSGGFSSWTGALDRGLSVAGKIMAKMGYREGAGLGKTGQGMSTALQVEKTSRRGGKIIHEKDQKSSGLMIPPGMSQDAPRALEEVPNTAELLRNPSKVVLLRNMVGPGEVDDMLEPETAEECSKYGKVNKVVIFEIPDTPAEEAVRIFVEFEKIDSAIKALIDLNGRYFGGKVVKACFYNLDKFRTFQLGD